MFSSLYINNVFTSLLSCYLFIYFLHFSLSSQAATTDSENTRFLSPKHCKRKRNGTYKLRGVLQTPGN